MAASHIFKVIFVNQGKVYEIYARKVGHGSPVRLHRGRGADLRGALRGGRRPVRGEDQSGIRRRESAHSAAALGDPHRRSPQVGREQRSAVEGGNVTQFPFPVYTPAAIRARARSKPARGSIMRWALIPSFAAPCRRASALRIPHHSTARRRSRFRLKAPGRSARFIHFVELDATSTRPIPAASST